MTVPTIALSEPVGPAGAPLVVLGPSLGTSTLLWEQVMPQLSAVFRVSAWDLPGHGASVPATAGFHVADIADALAAIVTEPVLYAGVSFGGCVGLELALRHPDLVRRAAIVASGAKVGDADAWLARAVQVRSQGTASLVTGSAERWFAPGSMERNPSLAGRLLHVLRDADDESYALACEALAVFDVRSSLGEIALPVLAVWGEHDAVTPESSLRSIADGVQHGSAVGITEASHLPPADNAAGTASVLLDWFGAPTKEQHA